MPLSVKFAHITDVHISDRDRSWSTVVSLAPQLLQNAFQYVNAIDDLDFVYLTGDVLDTGTRTEAEAFNRVMETLQKPWHFIPGNHDGYVDPNHPIALTPEEAVMMIDPRMGQDRTPEAQRSYYSREVKPGVRVIGLDSRLAEDWSGLVDAQQLAWLEHELNQTRNDVVILAVHHPLHALGPHNSRGRFPKFICENGDRVEALLDRFPNVKVVLSGHHHANHISRANGGRRVHICTSALSGYPCSFRMITIGEAFAGWRVSVESQRIGDEKTVEMAHDVATQDSMARDYDPDNPAAWVDFCAGRAEDITFDAVLPY